MTQDSTVSNPTAVRIREARLDDAVASMRLLYKVGLSGPDDESAIRESWHRLWVTNPARSLARPMPPIGWIMEADERIVGFFGNIPRRYEFGNRTLLVAVAAMWGVEKPFRTHTSLLSSAYFEQKNADLLLVTTAIAPTGRIFAKFAGSPVPQRDYDEALYWVLDSAAFLAAAFRRKGVPRTLAAPAAYALAPALAVMKHLPGRMTAGLETESVALSKVGGEFDELWQRQIQASRRLYAYRTASDIQWQFERHEKEQRLRIIRCRRGGRLEGYLVLVRDSAPEIGLSRAKIVDLFVAADDERVIDALLAAAHEAAVEERCHVLEAIGLPDNVRARFRRFSPFTRRFPFLPIHFKACSPDLQAALTPEDAWYLSLYDGDGTLG